MRGIIHCEFRAGGIRIDHFKNFLTRAAELTGNVAAAFVLDNPPCRRRARNVDIGNNGMLSSGNWPKFGHDYWPICTINAL